MKPFAAPAAGAESSTPLAGGERRRVAGLLAALVVAAVPPLTAQARGPGVPTTDSPIRLDGRLDEDAWGTALDLGPLRQREPREEVEPSERTQVLLLRDDDHLYVGVRCFDSQPDAVIGTQMARDADQAPDDSVEIVLDTFMDRRNGYYLQVNPVGARTDGLIANNGDPNRDWDGIWDARAARTADGWSAEIALPFKTLNFDPRSDTWGFNVQRTIKRKQETIRWRAARQNVRLTQVSEAGVLNGLGGVRQGRGLDVRPYGLLGAARKARGEPTRGDAQIGLDLVKNLTPSLSATLTVNTDFAETEVDARQINLTRFSLFVPEKRAFFLQNSSLFSTTGQGGRSDQPSGADVLPFFSRAIGLDARGEPLPVFAGAKLTGRAGPWGVGLLDIRTREDRGIPGRNFFVGRLSRNLGRQSLLGVLATHGSPAGDARPLLGVDGRYSRSDLFGRKNLVVEGAVFRTFLEDAEASGTWTAVGRIDYPNDPFSVNVSYKDIGSRFEPGMGFVPRRGVRKGSYNVDYFWRPRKWGVRHNHFELLTSTVHRPDGRLLNWRIFTALVNFRTESGEHVEWNYIPEYEYLDAPFAIRPGVLVPRGGYVMHRYRAELNTATKRRWVYDISVRHGGFYGGSRTETTTSLRFKANRHLALQAGLARNDVDLPQGSFETSVWQARVDCAFTPDVTLNNFFQYDSVSRIAGLNTRFRWTPKQGNDVFFVVNFGLLDEGERWVSAYKKYSGKLQYTLRF